MAAGILPKPGSKLGPCTRCEHTDCREIRSMAVALCPYCQTAIGYGRRYYRVGGQLVHADCHELAAERGAAIGGE